MVNKPPFNVAVLSGKCHKNKKPAFWAGFYGLVNFQLLDDHFRR